MLARDYRRGCDSLPAIAIFSDTEYNNANPAGTLPIADLLEYWAYSGVDSRGLSGYNRS